MPLAGSLCLWTILSMLLCVDPSVFTCEAVAAAVKTEASPLASLNGQSILYRRDSRTTRFWKRHKSKKNRGKRGSRRDDENPPDVTAPEAQTPAETTGAPGGTSQETERQAHGAATSLEAVHLQDQPSSNLLHRQHREDEHETEEQRLLAERTQDRK